MLKQSEPDSLAGTVLPVEESSTAGGASANAGAPSPLKWALVLLPLGYLWFRLIDNLRVEWTTNSQYCYGWVVPFLCGGLLLRRWADLSACAGQPSAGGMRKSTCNRTILIFLSLIFLYLPTRLIEEATPEWRLIQWSLGIQTVGLTLCFLGLAKGQTWLSRLAFPICFFLVAIPWPTVIETPIIQSLTRINSAMVVEFLSWLGIPAMQHGNLIEISTGTVGIDEACSGIRSLQTSLMAALFFGEFFEMALLRRLLLIPAGFVLAMALNVFRMTGLTIIAARRGIAALARFHDPAGIMITLVCMAGLWILALLLKKAVVPVSDGPLPAGGDIQAVNVSNSRFSIVRRLAFVLLLWLVVVDVGTELWYRSIESHQPPGPKWSVKFPTDNPTFRTMPISADTRGLLRFDEGEQAAWIDARGCRWQAFCFSWLPGRVAGYLAKRHTPEICLSATGRELLSGPKLTVMQVNNVELPMRSYVFGTEGNPLYVFQCRWEAGAGKSAYVQDESARFNLLRGIWAGRGNRGQKVLEFVLSGMKGPAEATAALSQELNKLVVVEEP
ncbi:MAG TPA: exosortase/archaeosortase family protein [Candidatus Cybelea sp.]|jgi:exosortase|nr:exosortase/archaeosortase family protein [Candidatus Cybelea sp.]